MLIGLYGYSRAGKDSVASVLVRNHSFEQRNMAGPIREVLLQINPPLLDRNGFVSSLQVAVTNHGWDWVKASHPETVEWMISLGQSIRDIDPSVWLNACVGPPYTNLVIADVRQPNEAEFIYTQGGELWRIEREGTEKRGMDGLLDDYDFAVEIKNNHTLEWLESLVNLIMEGRK